MARSVRLPIVRGCLLAALAGAVLAPSAGCSGNVSSGPNRQPVPAPSVTVTSPTSPEEFSPYGESPPVTFAVIGDYGRDNAHERDVADLVSSWDPSFVITTGDNYYSSAGGSGTGKYDESTGAYYGKWLKDISTTGKRYPVGTAAMNAFFPAMGNHDLSDATPSPRTYLTYFRLPGAGFSNTSGNERYYDFVEGPVHFFVLNSNTSEPDGTSPTSTQGRWLQRGLADSTSRWNVVYDHHPPYSSQKGRAAAAYMRWPFAKWGADAVLSGHAHEYERVMRDGIPFFVNGLGGAPRYRFSTPVPGSVIRYRDDWGAQKVTIGESALTFEFYAVSGRLVDRYSVAAEPE